MFQQTTTTTTVTQESSLRRRKLADSSDDEDEPRAAKEAARFDKDSILGAVRQLRVRASSLLPAEDMQEWVDWHAKAPSKLSEVDASERPLPLKMPMKCLPAAPDRVAVSTVREQEQLMVYQNPGGRVYSKAERERDAQQARQLTEDDLPVGSSVALKRHAGDPTEPGGYGTVFYIMDILSVELEDDGEVKPEGAEPVPRKVTKVTGHYRMPIFRGVGCNNEWRQWKPVCVSFHPYESQCETRRLCVCNRPAGQLHATSKYMAVDIEPSMIIETKVQFTTTGLLSAGAKHRLGQSAPEKGGWNTRLGVVAQKSQKKKSQ